MNPHLLFGWNRFKQALRELWTLYTAFIKDLRAIQTRLNADLEAYDQRLQLDRIEQGQKEADRRFRQ